ncbi:GyrI-like domain-containing protein [bacterium]|nr:GyrI-like domain-containing protein [bacterium]
MESQVEVKYTATQFALVIRGKTSNRKFLDALGTMLGGVWEYLRQHEIKPSGPPFIRYLENDGEQFKIEGGFPVPRNVEGEGQIIRIQIPSGYAATTWLHGPYEHLPEAHEVIHNWLDENGEESIGPSMEIYWTDPGSGAPPSEWKTEIRYPVRKR